MFFLRTTALLAILITPSFCLAQSWYQVEVIIFEHSEEVQSQQMPENWPNVLNLKWPSPLLELEPAVERQEPPVIKPAFEELRFDERNLNNDSYAIRVGSNYNLLWHKAWRAPIQPEEQAPWILVQAGEQLGEHYRLEGAIRIHLSRYLHLHSNLWLTEVTGEPIDDQPAYADGDNDEPTTTSFNLDQMAADINAQSRFDWSQLPEVSTVRWGCNYVREMWPEVERLLPANFYEDPAPADWYFPFGCRIPAEIPGKDLPIQLNYPTSNFLYRAEIEERFPEFIAAQQQRELFQDNHDLESIPLAPAMHPTNAPDISQDSAETREKPDAPEAQHALSARTANPPRVRYQVEEIVHIQSQRRMRSAEFHYIDHPKVGILAVIYPVEKPELDSEEQTP